LHHNHNKMEILKDALYVVNHSGGKDSQAMYLLLSKVIPAHQLVVIHANLPEVEWHGTLEHIQNTIFHELFVVQAKKTFLGMVENRGMFPSPKYRQCTSDLKRAPIDSKIIQICNERGFTKVVSCMGLRAQESSNRAKKETWRRVESKCNSKREWFEWLPIHGWSTEEVFGYISQNNQKPHWAYEKGMSRLSCCFCIMASREDLTTAAKLNPELYKKYVELEKKLDVTMMMPDKKKGRLFLEEITGIKAA